MYIARGGRLSGPAAEELAHRTHSAMAKYAGRVIPTRRQADALLRADPLLQVYPAEGLHCVFNAEKALCTREDDGPKLADCRSSCSNIARTDADIERVVELAEALSQDRNAPAIRHKRALAIIAQLDDVVAAHQNDPKAGMQRG